MQGQEIYSNETTSYGSIDWFYEGDVRAYYELYDNSIFKFKNDNSPSSNLPLKTLIYFTKELLDDLDERNKNENKKGIAKLLSEIDVTAMYVFHLLNRNEWTAGLRPIGEFTDMDSSIDEPVYPLGELSSEDFKCLQDLTIRLVHPLCAYEPSLNTIVGINESVFEHLILGFELGELGPCLGRATLNCLLMYMERYPQFKSFTRENIEKLREGILDKNFGCSRIK
ncbi:MAG: hypothetical protein CMO81_05735 [Waddliaceae bacterium]|nr:hypothetical protein [Waddliaceae bacterium]